MTDGKLQQVGSPQALYDTPVNKFVGGFIGSPSMNFIDVTTVASADGRLTLEGPGVTLPIPDQWREIVGTSSGRQIIAGFRPEHFTIGGAADASAKFTAAADVVEYLGSEELIHATVAGRDIVALLSSEHRVRPGDAIDLHVPLPKVHLFDSESNLSLTAQVAS
jgi:multiple sugar transport system ATP-binding protein